MVHVEWERYIFVDGKFGGIRSGNGDMQEDMYSMVLGKKGCGALDEFKCVSRQ